MATESRTITKALGGAEDLLVGRIDKVTQTRNGNIYEISGIDVPIVVLSTTELTALDITSTTRARIYATENLYTDYVYKATATSGVASSGSGFWIQVANHGVNTISGLQGLVGITSQSVQVGMYHNVTNTLGGGKFFWSTGRHDGGNFIDPNRTFPTDWTDEAAVTAWFLDSGTDVEGWKREDLPITHVEHYGWLADDTDCYAAFRKAANLNKPLELVDSRTYQLETQLVLSNGSFNRRGIYCKGQAKITSTSLTSSFVKIKGGSGQIPKILDMYGIEFEGWGSYQGVGLELAGSCGVAPDRLYFSNLSSGILFHNESSGEFTENCVVNSSRFKSCLMPVEYRVTSGNDSFHGTGIANNCWINTVTGYHAIYIGEGALVYNAPLSCVFFGTDGATALIKNDSGENRRPMFVGDIRMESHPGDISDGGMYLNGTVSGLDNWSLGDLRLTDTVKYAGPDFGNINLAQSKPYTFHYLTVSDDEAVSLGNNAEFFVSLGTGGDKFKVTASNNNGSFPLLSTVQVLDGDYPVFDNSGDTLQVVVPTAGTHVQVKVYPDFNPRGTNNGQVMEILR